MIGCERLGKWVIRESGEVGAIGANNNPTGVLILRVGILPRPVCACQHLLNYNAVVPPPRSLGLPGSFLVG